MDNEIIKILENQNELLKSILNAVKQQKEPIDLTIDSKWIGKNDYDKSSCLILPDDKPIIWSVNMYTYGMRNLVFDVFNKVTSTNKILSKFEFALILLLPCFTVSINEYT